MMCLAEGAADDGREAAGSGRDRLAGQVRLQVPCQIGGRGIAEVGRFLEALQGDQLQVPVDPGVEQMGRQRLLLQNQEDRVECRGGLERRSSGEHLVEDRTQAVDIAGRSDPAAAASHHLFGRHVARRSHDGSRGRKAGTGIKPLGQAEVGHVRPALEVDEDI